MYATVKTKTLYSTGASNGEYEGGIRKEGDNIILQTVCGKTLTLRDAKLSNITESGLIFTGTTFGISGTINAFPDATWEILAGQYPVFGRTMSVNK